jgi:hypothetical protein
MSSQSPKQSNRVVYPDLSQRKPALDVLSTDDMLLIREFTSNPPTKNSIGKQIQIRVAARLTERGLEDLHRQCYGE